MRFEDGILHKSNTKWWVNLEEEECENVTCLPTKAFPVLEQGYKNERQEGYDSANAPSTCGNRTVSGGVSSGRSAE